MIFMNLKISVNLHLLIGEKVERKYLKTKIKR